MRTLLVGSPSRTWREWLKANRRGRDLLILDPADPNHGTPGRVSLQRGDKAVAWRFIGSLEPTRNPIGVLQGAVQLMAEAAGDPLILLFPYRPAPVLRQLTLAIAQLLRPDEVLIPDESGFEGVGWPVGPQRVVLDPAFPDLVQSAQRRARWIELGEQGVEHDVLMDRVSIEGLRLGSGFPLTQAGLFLSDLGALHAESFGSTLFLVANSDIDDAQVSRALDLAQSQTATMVEPSAYRGLLCSFADQEGRDFGMGFIQSADFLARVFRVCCTAIPPAPVRILRVGSMRIDENGKELGETKPWSV